MNPIYILIQQCRHLFYHHHYYYHSLCFLSFELNRNLLLYDFMLPKPLEGEGCIFFIPLIAYSPLLKRNKHPSLSCLPNKLFYTNKHNNNNNNNNYTWNRHHSHHHHHP